MVGGLTLSGRTHLAARVDHTHNSVGWRDREHDLEKPNGTVRILGLGDSYLWGQGVHLEDTLLARLEDRLDLEMVDVRVEAINTRTNERTLWWPTLCMSRS